MSVTITKQVQFNGGAKGRKRLENATPKAEVPAGRMPRISRLMALAIHMQRLIDEGVVGDYAELARLGHVSRARITQIMNLNLLAPDIQEEILFLPRVERGRDPVREHAVRAIAAMADWGRQQRMWLRSAHSSSYETTEERGRNAEGAISSTRPALPGTPSGS